MNSSKTFAERVREDFKYLIDKAEAFDVATDEFKGIYESWYTECRRLIELVIPERLQDFIGLYRAHERKAINEATVSICDHLSNFQAPRSEAGAAYFNHRIKEIAKAKLGQQIAILRTCERALDSIIFRLKEMALAEMFDSEIEVAKELTSNGFLRAAGAVLGVVIEHRLAEICQAKAIPLSKTNPTISDFNDALKEKQVFSTEQWRYVSRLGDIRNICCHNKGVEPSEPQLKDLIDGAERLVRTVY